MGDSKCKEGQSAMSQSILEKFRELSKNKEEQLKGKISPNKGIKRNVDEVEPKEQKTNNYQAGLSETDVGITEYLSKHEGFTGIIKHRFSDFHVNEIDPDGNVIELTSLDVPVEKVEIPDNPNFKSVLSDEQWNELEDIFKSDQSAGQIEIDVTDKTKEERTAIHKAVKITYGSKIFSNTVEKDGKKWMNIGKCTKKGREERHQGGAFLHFTLYKENMDTTQTVHGIAKFLRIKPNFITYAGTKDKRGKTTQRMCVKQRSADVLAKCKVPRVTIGNYAYCHKPLRLGKLGGNRFKLAIRDIKNDDEVIVKAMESLEKTGFINYFGLQRFGSSSAVPTYAVGKELLLSNWKEAVELVLKPKNGEKCYHDIKMARDIWWESRDAVKAVKCLTKFDNTVEGKVLHTLKNQGNNAYINAIFAIPRNTLQLYLHSYQSLIWNRIVSRRIKEFGLVPIAGDLVFLEQPSALNETTSEVIEGEEESNVEKEDDVLEPSSDRKNEVKEVSKRIPVKTLTGEEAKETSIYDIIYPLPGFDIEYPNNAIREWYIEALKLDDMTEENLKNTHKTFSISGTYRKMVSRVDDLKWQTVHYQDVNEDLIVSDLDKMQNKTLPTHPDDSEHKAVVMEFKLKPSQYATMVLREVMKCETSGTHQASLSQDHNSTDNCKKTKTS